MYASPQHFSHAIFSPPASWEPRGAQMGLEAAPHIHLRDPLAICTTPSLYKLVPSPHCREIQVRTYEPRQHLLAQLRRSLATSPTPVRGPPGLSREFPARELKCRL